MNQNNKSAIITGILGQDGTYLAKHLLNLGYKVIGIRRHTSNSKDDNLRFLRGSPNFHLVYGDITDSASISEIVRLFQPDEFYHLAANSFVGCSWQSPEQVLETNVMGTLKCLEAIKQHKKDCKFYFAGSSEMYGDYVRRIGGSVILNESSPMEAASPYGVSKVAGYQLTKVYRESYGMFTACGILFNHSSAIRGLDFFTRKVTSQLAKIAWGTQEKIKLGNLKFQRDEGWANDYVKAMHLMLQQDKPDDYVIASGETHSGEEWIAKALSHFKLTENVIEIDQSLIRPNEVNILIGDSSKARSVLGWEPTCNYEELLYKMCQYDYYKQSPKQKFQLRADGLII